MVLTHFAVGFFLALRCHFVRILFCVTFALVDPDVPDGMPDAADKLRAAVVYSVAAVDRRSRQRFPEPRRRETDGRQPFVEYCNRRKGYLYRILHFVIVLFRGNCNRIGKYFSI